MVSRADVEDQVRQGKLESEGYVNLQIKSLQETINGELQNIMAVAASTDAKVEALRSESEKFALPLRDQPVDSVKLASVALSPVSVTSGSEWEAIRTVRLNKEPNKSLGISIVGGEVKCSFFLNHKKIE